MLIAFYCRLNTPMRVFIYLFINLCKQNMHMQRAIPLRRYVCKKSFRVCLDTAYFAVTEKLLLKIL